MNLSCNRCLLTSQKQNKKKKDLETLFKQTVYVDYK